MSCESMGGRVGIRAREGGSNGRCCEVSHTHTHTHTPLMDDLEEASVTQPSGT